MFMSILRRENAFALVTGTHQDNTKHAPEPPSIGHGCALTWLAHHASNHSWMHRQNASMRADTHTDVRKVQDTETGMYVILPVV